MVLSNNDLLLFDIIAKSVINFCNFVVSRMEEVEIQDIDFLYGCANPTIIIIHQDTMGRHIKAKELSIKDKEFVKVSLLMYFLKL